MKQQIWAGDKVICISQLYLSLFPLFVIIYWHFAASRHGFKVWTSWCLWINLEVAKCIKSSTRHVSLNFNFYDYFLNFTVGTEWRFIYWIWKINSLQPWVYFALSAPGLYILVFLFFLFNISTGEADKKADGTILHLEVLQNHDRIHKQNNFGRWFNNCLW